MPMSTAEVLPFPSTTRPRAPLAGRSILLVEDSRASVEAIRLYCHRLGARLRRADCVASAHRHLKGFRPHAAIVDLGLPDGSGIEVIAEMNRAVPRPEVIVATSGLDDETAVARAMRAGADGFLPKPVPSIAAFQAAVLGREVARIGGDGPVDPRPDPAMLIDDLRNALSRLRRARDAHDRDTAVYVARFVLSVLGGRYGAPGDDALCNDAAVGAQGLLRLAGRSLAWDSAALLLERALAAFLRRGGAA